MQLSLSSKRGIIAVLFWGLALVSAAPAAAHGYIVRAVPPDRAVLERAPVRLQYWFSESLERRFSSVNVRDQTGQIIVSGGVSDDDDSLLSVRLPPDLPDGAYIVELRPAFASDGHVVVESRVFFVGEEVGGVFGSAASGAAVALEVIWRVLVLSSTFLLFGAHALYAVVLLPAWGNAQYKAGMLPPRLMGRLNWVVGAALAAAFAGNALALLQQSMAFFGVDAGQVISQNLWDVVRIGSRFGDVWSARMLLLALVALLYGLSLYLRQDQPESVRAFWTANVWALALVIGTFSVSSHAPGSLLLPWVAMTVDWIHALGVAFWVGGVCALALVLPAALRPYEGEARRLALLVVMRRFSRWATVCVLVVVTSGVYSALNWFYRPADLTQTSYGGALILKLLLVALLLLVGGLHHLALRPHLGARVEARLNVEPARRGYKRLLGAVLSFSGSLRLEVIAVLAVLGAVGLLSATPVPPPDFVQENLPAPSQTQNTALYSVTLSLSPGGPGVNSYDVLVLRDETPLDDVRVQVQWVNPLRDWRGTRHTAENVENGLYVAAGDDLDRPGQWWALVTLSSAAGEKVYLAFDWSIDANASVVDTRPFTLLHGLALGGVAAAVIFAFYPLLQGYARRLDFSPRAVLVALGAVCISVLLLVGGFMAVQDSRARYQALLFPPPQVVNTVLPDTDSLERGRALFVASCGDWPTVERDFNALREGALRLRDEALYDAVLNGWRALPPCASPLTPEQRWDIVNYFRTLGD